MQAMVAFGPLLADLAVEVLACPEAGGLSHAVHAQWADHSAYVWDAAEL